MSSERPRIGDGAARLILAAGFLAVSVAVWAAYTAPAIEYEVSIYAATPPIVWIGVAAAFLASIAVAPNAATGTTRGLAMLLGGLATAVVAGLPVLRSYHFYGTADALTHLGWTKDLASGVTSPFELIYPGVHTASVLLDRAGGFGPERALLVVVFVAFLALLVFVPLIVRTVVGPGDAVAFGAFGAFLLLPISNGSTHPSAHPFTQTVLLSALVVFLLLRYVRQSDGPARSFPAFDPTAVGALLALVGAATVVYHPQQAANVIVLFASVSLVQFVYRFRSADHPIAAHRPLYAQTAFLVVVFLAWTTRYELLYGAVDTISQSLVGYFTGEPTQAAASVQTQGESLAAIGSGLVDIFLRLFLANAVVTALAGAVILASLAGRLDATERGALVKYLSVGAFAIVPLFAVYVLGSISAQYFRHFGFLMVLVTVLGALALARIRGGPSGVSTPLRTTVVSVAVAALLVASLLSVFPSPYIYVANPHVTEQAAVGYEAAFELHDEDVPLLGVRQGPWRESEGVQGVATAGAYRANVPDGSLGELREEYDDPRYLVVTQYDYERELVAYQQLRYTQRGVDSLDRQPGVGRLMSNGDVSLYYVRPDLDGVAANVR
jgi:hypothetical protein